MNLFGFLAYLVPTFALGFVWHLVLFEPYYDALAIYRRDIIIPFGFLSMVIQAAIFAWVYGKAFAMTAGSALSRALRYGCAGAVLSWSFTTPAVAAKNVMALVKICCGIVGRDLMVRILEKDMASALKHPHVRPMDFTGKPLRGFVYVAPQGVATADSLRRWVLKGVAFVKHRAG